MPTLGILYLISVSASTNRYAALVLVIAEPTSKVWSNIALAREGDCTEK